MEDTIPRWLSPDCCSLQCSSPLPRLCRALVLGCPILCACFLAQRVGLSACGEGGHKIAQHPSTSLRAGFAKRNAGRAPQKSPSPGTGVPREGRLCACWGGGATLFREGVSPSDPMCRHASTGHWLGGVFRNLKLKLLITRRCVPRPIPTNFSSINMLREAKGLVSLVCPLRRAKGRSLTTSAL